jgi:hypothetical protein
MNMQVIDKMSRVQYILDLLKKNAPKHHGARNVFRAWKQKSKRLNDLSRHFGAMGIQSTRIQKHYQLMKEAGTTDPVELQFYKNTRPGKPIEPTYQKVRKVMCNVVKEPIVFPVNKRIQEIRNEIIENRDLKWIM